VLVTVLFSRTLPLIRYEMSDSVRLAADPSCGCGRPYRLLDAIQGRE
jgi:phenylacetate-coenzyme A ligase PaaK-like adenylate-forming protein